MGKKLVPHSVNFRVFYFHIALFCSAPSIPSNPIASVRTKEILTPLHQGIPQHAHCSVFCGRGMDMQNVVNIQQGEACNNESTG